jgi:branched-chain amino acid transport system substrate-binding protein
MVSVDSLNQETEGTEIMKVKALTTVVQCSIVVALGIGSAVAQPAAGSSKPLRIGVMTDISGQFSHEAGQGAVTAVKMAVDDFGGKVLGRPIEVLVNDHQNKPDVAATKAREWFDTQNVRMINNLINSGVALSVIGVAKEKNGIAIVNGSGSSRITGDACTPNSIHYAYDTYALANGTGKAIIGQGGDSWFFLTADYAFGHSLEADTAGAVKAKGGRVIGAVRYPINTSDHSSFLLQAQASKAKVVALAGSGTGFINAVKSAHEFGLTKSGQTLAGLLVWVTDVDAMGLEVAQGLTLTSAFYWDHDADTRAWSKRFFALTKRMPTMGDAGDYSSTLHYLKSVQAAGTDDTAAVMAKMKATPINDMFAKNGRIRADGRMVHDMYVYQVKKPSESKYPWDYYKFKSVIPADQAFRPLAEGGCPLVKK